MRWIFKNSNLLIVLGLSILPFIFIFSTSQFFYTQDGWTHLARGGAFYKALLDGQFPVRWAGDLNYSYGMPLFNYVFQIPYISMTPFIFAGLGLVWSLKIVSLISFVVSGIFMYLFSRAFFEDERKALFVTVFYQFFPFRLVDMFVRGSIGEMFAFAFLPLALFGIVSFYKKSKIFYLGVTAIGVSGMLLSHLATGGFFVLITAFFAVMFSPKIKKVLWVFASFALGVGLSAYYSVNAVIDHKYTYGNLFAKDLYLEHFAPFFNFFIPNFLNNPIYRTGDVPIQIGVFHVLAVIASLFVFITNRNLKVFDKKLVIFCFIIVATSFFLMLPVSSFAWENFPFFKQFQFPWRFLASLGFATSLLSVYFLYLGIFKKKIIYFVFLALVVLSTAYYWYPQLGFRSVNEGEYWNYPLDTTYFGETNLVWSAGPASGFPKYPVEVIAGEAVVSNIYRRSNLHTYEIDARTTSTIVDHTQFFPGWRVYVGGKEVPIQFQDANYRGEITYEIPEGKHQVTTSFSETKQRLLLNIVSISAVVILIGVLLSGRFSKLKNKKNEKK